MGNSSEIDDQQDHDYRRDQLARLHAEIIALKSELAAAREAHEGLERELDVTARLAIELSETKRELAAARDELIRIKTWTMTPTEEKSQCKPT